MRTCCKRVDVASCMLRKRKRKLTEICASNTSASARQSCYSSIAVWVLYNSMKLSSLYGCLQSFFLSKELIDDNRREIIIYFSLDLFF